MPNPYINWWTDTSEQNLLQDLTTEFITMHAFPAIYMPRTMRREDPLYNEDILSQFTQTYTIDAYIQNVQGWDGQGDFLSKFGIRVNDKVNVLVSRATFNGLIADQTRPNEGDLLYFPAPIDAAFEVKFVEHEKSPGQFYPLGGLYFYDITCELHVYSHESIATGNTDIDLAETEGYAQDLTMLAGGTGTFTTGETVYQGDSILTATASGVVASWDGETLRVTNIMGSFAEDEPVNGSTSMAVFTLAAEPDVIENPNDPTNDNRYLDDLRDDVLDTSEVNPITGR